MRGESEPIVAIRIHPGAEAEFPFAVVFTVREERVIIEAFAHQRRAPGYWLGRIASGSRKPDEGP